MGWDNAASLAEALALAKQTGPANPQITLLKQPPVVMTRCI